MYNSQQRPRFSWRYWIVPGVSLATFLLIILTGNKQPFSNLSVIKQLTRPEITQSDISDQNSNRTQQDEGGRQTQLAETPVSLDQLEQELTELSNTLNADSDLEAAIVFNNL